MDKVNILLVDDQPGKLLSHQAILADMGENLVLANAAGQEFTISKKSIKERRESPNSLMPENFGEILPEADFNNLLAYLMAQAATARPK